METTTAEEVLKPIKSKTTKLTTTTSNNELATKEKVCIMVSDGVYKYIDAE